MAQPAPQTDQSASTIESRPVMVAGLGLPTGIDPQLALRAAQATCTILVTGETGAGKGHLALWIHEHSHRARGPFIPVNCGAIPESLIDSQLFGHARGAFTGATAEHIGLVRAAEHGTLLLDEISELPPTAQNRLLRLLQDQEVQPIGHSHPIVVDVRVIASTNTDLSEAVKRGKFREDLLFRLDVIPINVPPLRERLEEIPRLLNAFNREFGQLYQQHALEFDRSVYRVLSNYHWPGNIRQLRTLIERLHVLCPGEQITVAHVLEFGQLYPPPRVRLGREIMQRLKVEQVQRVLAESGGSIVRAAEVLGVHRSTIYRWLRGQ